MFIPLPSYQFNEKVSVLQSILSQKSDWSLEYDNELS